jgi:uncharacterized membrane protein YphA (DoxX/SURF4 family)
MPDAFYPWMHLIGRISFAMVFIGGGVNHFAKLNDTAMYAKSRGVPFAKVATILAGLMSVAGGTLIAMGWHRFIGAGLVAIFALLTAFMMHNFWRDADPMAKQEAMAHFMKNLALAGAALFIAYYSGEGWPMSVGG